MHTKQSPEVQFHYLQKTPFTNRILVKETIKHLFKKEKKILGQLTYIFCSDEYLLQINKEYLQHNYYTDIITFDLSDTNNQVNGEVYISIDRVKDNAKTFQTGFQKELLRVIFHGALHLCGYKDKSKSEEALMRKTEDKYLHYFLSKIKQ